MERTAVITSDSEDKLRRAVEAEYARIGRAMAEGDLEAILTVYAPDFEGVAVSGEERDLPAIMVVLKRGVANAADLSFVAKVDTIAPSGGEAIVTVLVTQTSTGSLASQKFKVREEEARHDTWVMHDGGWRLRRSETQLVTTWVNDKLVSQQTLVRPLTAQERAAVVHDVGVYAHPFKTVLAGNGFDDLDFLDKIIGDARLVALGEASHGTAEFFQMKHRVLEYLVERKGFTVFAIEGNWPEAHMADHFVKNGDGDVAAALAAMYFWTWQTVELRAMLDWMRAYNTRRGDRPILSFAGFDMQITKVAISRVLDYLGRLSQVDRDQVQQLYVGIEKLDGETESEISAEEKVRLKENAVKALVVFDARREALLGISTPEEYREARQAARIVLQACEMHVGIGWDIRDRAMADNVQWLLEERFPDEKLVIWAHNGHVGTASIGGESQGMQLRGRYGAQMVVLGFASHHGEVRAKRMEGDTFQPGPPVAMPLPPARPVSVEALFQQSGMPRFILDFRNIPTDSALGRWLGRPRLHRSIGAAYDPEPEGDVYLNTLLPAMYDGIIFIAESSAAKPLQ